MTYTVRVFLRPDVIRDEIVTADGREEALRLAQEAAERRFPEASFYGAEIIHRRKSA